jgi:hypothetical protein
MSWAESSKASMTFKAPARVFLFISRTYTRPEKSHMATFSVTISLTKRKNNASDSQWAATSWITPAKWQPRLQISLHSKYLSTAHCLQKMLE